MSDPRRLTVAQLTHDLKKGHSFALITWDDDAERRLGFWFLSTRRLKTCFQPLSSQWLI